MPDTRTDPPTGEPAGPENATEAEPEGEDSPGGGDNQPTIVPRRNNGPRPLTELGIGPEPELDGEHEPELDGEHEPEGEPESFDRAYVERLRRENASYRERAGRADGYAHELFTLRVAALDRLADPTDLAYDEALIDDRAALEAAVDELVARKPHLGDRRPTGTVDQGARDTTPTADLAGIVRGLAG